MGVLDRDLVTADDHVLIGKGGQAILHELLSGVVLVTEGSEEPVGSLLSLFEFSRSFRRTSHQRGLPGHRLTPGIRRQDD